MSCSPETVIIDDVPDLGLDVTSAESDVARQDQQTSTPPRMPETERRLITHYLSAPIRKPHANVDLCALAFRAQRTVIGDESAATPTAGDTDWMWTGQIQLADKPTIERSPTAPSPP